MDYAKPFLTYEQQASHLMSAHGLLSDRDDLMRQLGEVGYYRLSGYWRIFLDEETGDFQDGTTFIQVWGLYVFDRQFRLLVLDAVERVEIYMRSQLAYLLAQETGPFGYADRTGLPRLDAERYEHFMSKCYGAFARAKRGEPFAKHFADKYGDAHSLPPYWMLVNFMDFGMVVTLYKGASVPVRLQIAKEFGFSSKVLDSWLVTINTVRNVCCHHGRLWNRVLGNPPRIPKASEWHEPFEVANDRIFGTLTALSYLLEYVAPDTSWRGRLFALMDTLPERYHVLMGFGVGWDKCPIWSKWLPESEEDA